MPDTGKASQAETLAEFRKQLFAEDILHEGDTVGTDDETLLYVDFHQLLTFVCLDACYVCQ